MQDTMLESFSELVTQLVGLNLRPSIRMWLISLNFVSFQKSDISINKLKGAGGKKSLRADVNVTH